MSEYGKDFDKALDRYITGNYGENQFKDESEVEAEEHKCVFVEEFFYEDGVEYRIKVCKVCGDWR